MLELKSKTPSGRFTGKEGRRKKRSIQAIKRAYVIDMNFQKHGYMRALS